MNSSGGETFRYPCGECGILFVSIVEIPSTSHRLCSICQRRVKLRMDRERKKVREEARGKASDH